MKTFIDYEAKDKRDSRIVAGLWVAFVVYLLLVYLLA